MAFKFSLEDGIRQCRQATDKHLQALNNEIDYVIDEAMKTDQDREQEEAAQIKQDVQKKYEDRDKQLELNKTNAEKRRERIRDKQLMFHADLRNIAKEIQRKIGEFKLEKPSKENKKTTHSKPTALRKLLQDKLKEVKDGDTANTSAIDEQEKHIDKITRTVRDLRFIGGTGREKYNGRIDGYDVEWRLIDTINVKYQLRYPTIVGCIGERMVLIKSKGFGTESTHTFTLDIITKHIERVITSSSLSGVTSCALLNDDKVVCGNYDKSCGASDCSTCESLTGFISVYDQRSWQRKEWKLNNDVKLPEQTRKVEPTWVDVAADQDGMIIAGEVKWSVVGEKGKSTIYVINPADGKIIDTIMGKDDVLLRGVQLSSGNIVAQPLQADRRVLLMNRQGARREIPHGDVILNVCVDPLTDDLYVVTSGREHKTCVIDQVMSGGDVKQRRVALFPVSTSLTERDHRMGTYYYKSEDYRRFHLIESRVVMTSSGEMIASDGEHILVFKKLLSL